MGKLSERIIMDAALQAVSKYSISNTRMRNIAKEADTAPSNLLYYYESKDDLLNALLLDLERLYAERQTLFFDDCDDDLASKISCFFEQKKDIILNHPNYDQVQMDFWVVGQIDDKVRENFLPSYVKWQGYILDEINKYIPHISEENRDLLSYIMISLMMGASMQYLNTKGGFDLDKYFDLCKTMVLGVIDMLEKKAPETAD